MNARHLSTTALALLAWVAVVALVAGDKAGGHLMDKPCEGCHLSSRVGSSQAGTLVSSQEQLCGPCHADAIRLSHPTGFKPSRKLPAAFPLDWKGELTCSSCHDIHADDVDEALRGGKSGEAFCTQCHDAKFFAAMADRGESLTPSGHLAARTEQEQDQTVLDAYSLQCMGCHGGEAGGPLVTIKGEVVQHQGSDVAHPIGGVYADAVATGGYRTTLPPEVILPDGKVSCISCHQGYAPIHGNLVILNVGSALCLTCHDM